MECACAYCGKYFVPCPTVPNQRFCGRLCRRAKQREVQKERVTSDPDYRENQRRAQRAWQKRNPDYMRDYMREYRKRRPGYVARNQGQQRKRNQHRRRPTVAPHSHVEPSPVIVNMVEFGPDPILVPGPYRVVFEKGGLIVKMGEFLPHPMRLCGVFPSSACGGS